MSNKIELTAIGIIHSPYLNPGQAPIQGTEAGEETARVEIWPEYAQGLDDVDGFDCLWVIWFSHLAGPARLKVVPYMDEVPRGVFATRAPSRPNPVGMTCVKLLRREDNILAVSGVDMIEGTPVLDLKPYIPFIDARPGCSRDGWIESRRMKKPADDRFMRGRSKSKD